MEEARMTCKTLLAFSFLGSLCVVGCGGSGSGMGGQTPTLPPTASVTSVAVSCASATVNVGQTSQCSATVQGTGNYSSAVTWSVNSVAGGNATFGTVSASGLFTAPATVPGTGAITIEATSQSDPSRAGNAAISLVYPVPTVISISPTSVAVGSASTTVFVVGTGFNPLTAVSLNGSNLPTTFVSGTSVTVVVPQASEATIGKFPITASNPVPGGGTSIGSAQFDVTGGVLNVNVTDLPSATSANIVLTGQGGMTTPITHSTSLQLPVGTYILKANSVLVGSSTYFALAPTQSITVAGFSNNTMTVDYKNIVPSTTKVLDTIAESSLSISSNGITLTMSSSSPVAQSLAVGDVIVVPPTPVGGVAPMGLLRKVLTASNNNSQIIVTTQQGTLADAFERVSFQLQTQLTSQAIQSVRPANGVIFHPGASIHMSRSGVRPLSASGTVSDPCNGFSLGVFDVSKSINSGIVPGLTLNGQVELCSGLDFSIDLIGQGFLGLQPKLNAMTASATMGEYSDLTLQGTFLQGLFDPAPIQLGTLTFPPMEVPGLPIWVTPQVGVFVGAKGSLSSGISTEMSSAGTFSGGVSYASGAWSPIPLQPSLQFAYTPPTLDASLNAKAYAGIQFDLYV
ncbi:MAG: Ig-like domain-containing protein, partial [Candidatus Limnocylindrales bacterium]